MTLYRFVDAQRAEGFQVRLICSVVGVSPSAYYAYRERPEDSPAQLARVCWSRRSEPFGQSRLGHVVRPGCALSYADGAGW